jgi:hypothetical protein
MVLQPASRTPRNRPKRPRSAAARGHHEGVRKVVILGRGGAGKSALSRKLSDVTGIPAVELAAAVITPSRTTTMDP